MSCQVGGLSDVVQGVISRLQDSSTADIISGYDDPVVRVSVWEHSQAVFVETIDHKNIFACMRQLSIKSLCELNKITESGVSDIGENVLLCCFLEVNCFVKERDKVVKLCCSFREVCPNGDFGSYFKATIHSNFAQQLYDLSQYNRISSGDVVVFVNPLVFLNPAFNSNLNEQYALETGFNNLEKICFYKLENRFASQTNKDCMGNRMKTKLQQSSVARCELVKRIQHPRDDEISSKRTEMRVDSICSGGINHKPGIARNAQVAKTMSFEDDDKAAEVQEDTTHSQDPTIANQICCYENAIVRVRVWEYRCASFAETIDCKKMGVCLTQLNIKSLGGLKIVAEKGKLNIGDKYSLLCCFEELNNFVMEGDKAVRVCCSFREIGPNGKLGSYFKATIHSNFAHQLYDQYQYNQISPGDVVVFIDPVVFINPSFKYNLIEPYVLETGFKESEKIIFYKLENGFKSQTKHFVAKWLETNLPQGSVASPHKDKTNLTSQIPSNLMNDSVKQNLDAHVILVSLENPTKDMVASSILYLVSGYCSQSCHQMFNYHAILWNKEKKAQCPKCFLTVDLNFCLLFCALLVHSQRLLNIVLTGKKADKFLEVSCQDFMDDQEKRKTALKALERKYVNGSEYKVFRLKLSDVTQWSDIC